MPLQTYHGVVRWGEDAVRPLRVLQSRESCRAQLVSRAHLRKRRPRPGSPHDCMKRPIASRKQYVPLLPLTLHRNAVKSLQATAAHCCAILRKKKRDNGNVISNCTICGVNDFWDPLHGRAGHARIGVAGWGAMQSNDDAQVQSCCDHEPLLNVHATFYF